MLVLFQQVILLAVTLLALVVEAQVCDTGWFGENCMFQCRCIGGCDNNGACSTGTCEQLYFGPACQFLDAAAKHKTAPLFYNDHNETTCNPNAAATSIEMTLNITIPFLWFRVHTDRNSKHLNFTTTINRTAACTSEKKYFGEDFVDVTCGNSRLGAVKLRIDGPIASEVCSIYISLGHNVALKQNASHFPEYGYIRNSSASNAVDGNLGVQSTSPDMPCSTVQTMEVKPWWNLTYNRPQTILYVYILNRLVYRERLNNFTLMGRDANGRNTINFQHYVGLWTRVNYLDLIQFPQSTTVTISITIPVYALPSLTILTLCEVQTFGETECPEGMYGLWCGETCSCEDGEVCLPATGSCGARCPPGTYSLNGFGCSLTCNNCKDGLCHHQTGKCFNCLTGYYGNNCDTACTPGTYGDGCQKNCSNGCTGICNHVSGVCTCTDKFVGDTCDDCIDKHFGPACDISCAAGCTNRTCEKANGECFSCEVGYYGPKCESSCPAFCANGTCVQANGECSTCEVGYTGPKCEDKCATFCANGTCDQANGECFSCEVGYTGPSCEDKCPALCENGICNHANGECSSCEVGYTGPKCEDKCPTLCANRTCNQANVECFSCEVGYTGPKCEAKCPTSCANGTCDQAHGECFKCEVGYTGPTCEAKCPTFCANSLCDRSSGNCFSCKNGYTGIQCATKNTEGEIKKGFNWIFFLIVGVISLALLGVIFAACKQRTEDVQQEGYNHEQSMNPQE